MTGWSPLPTSSSSRSRCIRSRSRRRGRSSPSSWPSSGRLSRSWRRPTSSSSGRSGTTRGGTRRSMAIFALNTLTNWQQLRETVGNVSAEGIRPFLYCLALVCDKRMTFLKIVKVCHRPVSKRSRVTVKRPTHIFCLP